MLLENPRVSLDAKTDREIYDIVTYLETFLKEHTGHVYGNRWYDKEEISIAYTLNSKSCVDWREWTMETGKVRKVDISKEEMFSILSDCNQEVSRNVEMFYLDLDTNHVGTCTSFSQMTGKILVYSNTVGKDKYSVYLCAHLSNKEFDAVASGTLTVLNCFKNAYYVYCIAEETGNKSRLVNFVKLLASPVEQCHVCDILRNTRNVIREIKEQFLPDNNLYIVTKEYQLERTNNNVRSERSVALEKTIEYLNEKYTPEYLKSLFPRCNPSKDKLVLYYGEGLKSEIIGKYKNSIPMVLDLNLKQCCLDLRFENILLYLAEFPFHYQEHIIFDFNAKYNVK